MACKQRQACWLRHKEEPLPPAQIAEWKRHASACPDCARFMDGEQALAEALAREAEVRAPEGFNRAVWARIEASRSPLRIRPRWLPLAAAVAAAAALLFCLVPAVRMPVSPVTRAQVAECQIPRERESAARSAPAPAPTAFTARARPTAPATVRSETRTVLKIQAPAGPSVDAEPVVHEAAAPPVFIDSRDPAAGTPLPQTAASAENGASWITAAGMNAAGNTAVPQFTGSRLLNNKLNLSRGERARLELNVEQPGYVSAKIYTREGRLVKVLLDGFLPAGCKIVEWDGKTAGGGTAASGIYLLAVNGTISEKRYKLVVIR